ncbi:hypothetical protein BJY24_006214 [Nocardia transvalensis]|uniref:Uncharacterized protein n=1 Tax=Nocardia transvalensis TaxID=37333 RepID=A0A7W9PJG5_9NOCA|nr:hypothetical protein [Nocardia transvalensis]MBB5917302.1 hypothetical protein [Nocardia transvalensis]
MFDPLSLVVGAGLVGVGWACGRAGRRRARAAEVSPSLCGCGHELALHDREQGSCHAETFRKTGYGMKAWSGCQCRRYTGPAPLEDLLPPTVLPPTS